MAPPSLVKYAVPAPPDVQKALAEVVVRHEHLQDVLVMTIKIIEDITPNEARKVTKFVPVKEIRKRVRKAAVQRFGEGETLRRIERLLQRASEATDARNEWIHSICVHDIADPTTTQLYDGEEMEAYPSVRQLKELSETLRALAVEINSARLSGFIAEGMAEWRQRSKPTA